MHKHKNNVRDRLSWIYNINAFVIEIEREDQWVACEIWRAMVCVLLYYILVEKNVEVP